MYLEIYICVCVYVYTTYACIYVCITMINFKRLTTCKKRHMRGFGGRKRKENDIIIISRNKIIKSESIREKYILTIKAFR